MEGLRFFLAIVLSIAVIIITNLLFPPEPAPDTAGVSVDSAAAGVAPDTGAEARSDTGTLVAEPPELAPDPRAVAADTGDAALPADTIWVETPLARYGFSTRGGAIVSVELLNFESFTDGGPVQIVPELDPLASYGLVVDGRALPLDRLLFTPSVSGDTVRLREGSGPRTISFRYSDDAGVSFNLDYTLEPSRYVVDVQGRLDGVPGAPILMLSFAPAMRVTEPDSAEDLRAMAYIVNSRRDGIRSVPLDDVEEEGIEEGPLSWVAMKSKYWVIVAFTDETGASSDFGGLIARPVEADNAADLNATLPIGREGTFAFHYFIGPLDLERLGGLGRNLEDVNPYGYRIFQPIIRPLARLATWLLVGMHGVLGLGYGWILIIFGAFMRVVLWPLNAKAMRSQLKTMEMQPRIKEIQEKYKKTPELQQKEMMKLYKEEGFNPLGGCLPMLLPWPVLITLFFVFQNTIEFRGVEFLWLPDLSRPDPFYLLPVILGVSFFLMQWMSLRSSPQQNPQAKMMMYVMPVFMVVIFVNLASGLNLYYAASNLFSIPQQVQIVRERRKAQARIQNKKEREKEGATP